MPTGRRCAGPHRTAIDKALIEGQPLRKIARAYAVGHQSIMRHRDTHLSRSLRQTAARLAEVRAIQLTGTLAEQVAELRNKAAELLCKAEAAGDLRTALLALREISRLIELFGRFTGQFNEDGALLNSSTLTSPVVIYLPDNGRGGDPPDDPSEED